MSISEEHRTNSIFLNDYLLCNSILFPKFLSSDYTERTISHSRSTRILSICLEEITVLLQRLFHENHAIINRGVNKLLVNVILNRKKAIKALPHYFIFSLLILLFFAGVGRLQPPVESVRVRRSEGPSNYAEQALETGYPHVQQVIWPRYICVATLILN